MAQLRNLARGFQDELQAALNEPLEQMRSTVDTVRNPLSDDGKPTVQPNDQSTAEPTSSPRVEPRSG